MFPLPEIHFSLCTPYFHGHIYLYFKCPKETSNPLREIWNIFLDSQQTAFHLVRLARMLQREEESETKYLKQKLLQIFYGSVNYTALTRKRNLVYVSKATDLFPNFEAIIPLWWICPEEKKKLKQWNNNKALCIKMIMTALFIKNKPK